MKIFIATPRNHKKTFIVGSNPVVRFEDYPFQPLGEKGVELWTTLSPTIAVGFATQSGKDPHITLSSDEVRKINVQLTRQSRAIAGASKKLLSSLATAEW